MSNVPSYASGYSLVIIASKAYLIGLTHYNQTSQLGIVCRLEKNPLNSINGITINGATIEAVAKLWKMLLTK
jgi:hypothetical protein